MKTFVNIRGTNGSGKSTLARRFIEPEAEVVPLFTYLDKRSQKKTANGLRSTANIVVGSYATMAGGLDKLPSFAIQRGAIAVALELSDLVIAEGILASTVYGSWAEQARVLREDGVRVVWAFMTTPVEECLRRIQVRNGGRPIKEDLVRGKEGQIERVRLKAVLDPNIEVVQLPYEDEYAHLLSVL